MGLGELLQEIKGNKHADNKAILALMPREKEFNYINNHFPACIFSGEFSKGIDKEPTGNTGIMIISLKRLDTIIKRNICYNCFYVLPKSPILFGFTSTSYDGFKIGLRVDIETYTYEENYEAGIKYVKSIAGIPDDNFDRLLNKINDRCIINHDENIFINEKIEGDDISGIVLLDTAKWLPKEILQIEKEEVKEVQTTVKIIDVSKDDIVYLENSKLDFEHKAQHTNYNKLQLLALNKAGKYRKGNRHNYMRSLSFLANRFGMPLQQTIKYTIEYFKDHQANNEPSDPIDVENDLVPIIKESYEKYKDKFDSWGEQEVGEEFETPCLPDEVYDKLPAFLKGSSQKFETRRDKDIYLIAALGVISNCFPLVKGCYDESYVSMNLFMFLIAPPSSGKNKMKWARKLGKAFKEYLKEKYQQELGEYEEQLKLYETTKGEDKGSKPIKPIEQNFYLSANISTSALITSMCHNGFHGLIFETEAISLTNMLKNDWANYADILLKAFHQEPITKQRVNKDENVEIENPFLSMVLSGTPDQIPLLLSSIESGFFSRLLIYDFPQTLAIKNVFARRDVSFDNYFDGMSKLLFSYAKPFFQKTEDDFSNQVVFEFTLAQQAMFQEWLGQKMVQLNDMYGADIIPSVKRLGFCFFKISMLFSTLRFIENKVNNGDGNIGKEIICEDIDYSNAEIIINTLLFHTVKVFRQIKKFKRNKSTVSLKDSYYTQLPDEFNRTVWLEVAALLGINGKTAEGYIAGYVQSGALLKPKHNHYVKAA